MDLSSEDSLKINVLLANKPKAIRIQESSMTLYGLTDSGDASIKLNPNCRDEQYIKKVKEVLSSHISGSPGGYPVYIQRWTRMGQMRDDSLEQLLVLGEPEAVVAAACAAGLTDELARRAWWAMEDAENARRMLEHEDVVKGRMGPILASYLIEHLPFEVEPEKMIETVRLVLQPGLVDQKAREDLWKKGLRKGAYHVGFILTTPDELPIDTGAHDLSAQLSEKLDKIAENGNNLARFINKLLSQKGQSFLEAIKVVLKKPSNQEVVHVALDAVRYYFAPLRPEGNPDQTFEELRAEAQAFVEQDSEELRELAQLHENMPAILFSARVMSGMSYGVLRPVFHGTSAIGSLMRRKLEPVFKSLDEEINVLSAKTGK